MTRRHLEIEDDALAILRDADKRGLEESATPASMPNLPSIAFHGLAGQFVDTLERSTEAPREFRLAAFLTVIGALIGRSAWVHYSRPTYPNLYSLLIGETANARKTTVMSFGIDLMAEVAENCGAKVKPLYGIASVEGLGTAMRDKEALEPYRIVAVEDELKSLMRKSQQKAVSNIVPRLTELYNCGRRFEINTKADTTAIDAPFLSIVSGSTPTWFAESMGDSEISGGFFNRWCMWVGRPTGLIPFPEPVPGELWESLVGDIASAVRNGRGEYQLAVDARSIFEEFYYAFRKRRHCEGLRGEATSRADVHAMKYGLLYAIQSGHKTIEADDIARGIAVANFNLEVALSVISDAGLSWVGAQENKLLELLKTGRISTRDATRHLHISAMDLNRIATALKQAGLIDVVSETTSSGRRRVFLEAI